MPQCLSSCIRSGARPPDVKCHWPLTQIQKCVRPTAGQTSWFSLPNWEFEPFSWPALAVKKGVKLRLWPRKPPMFFSDFEFASGGLGEQANPSIDWNEILMHNFYFTAIYSLQRPVQRSWDWGGWQFMQDFFFFYISGERLLFDNHCLACL